MALYYLEEKSLRDLDRTSFISEGIKERSDLQRYLLNRIDIISPDLFVITEEFSEWESSMRRIDILCIDKNANLVVIEIKRDSDGSHMELQSVRYASMISSLKFDTLVDIYKQYLVKNGKGSDTEKALDSILNFLGWDSPQEDNFANDTRVILVAEDFSKEITTSVLWLNERDLDITCIKIAPYKFNDNLILEVQQVIPLPEAQEYQIQIKEKLSEKRQQSKIINLEEQLNARNKIVRELYDSLKLKIMEFGKDIKEVPGKGYVDYRKNTTFVNVGFRMDYIKIMIKMGDEKIVDSKGVCSEIPKSFGYGRMTKMFDVKSLDDVDYAISLIKQAYDIN